YFSQANCRRYFTNTTAKAGLGPLPSGREEFPKRAGGGSGIRTHVTVSRKHAFQACAFSHSATPPHQRASIRLRRRALVTSRAPPSQPRWQKSRIGSLLCRLERTAL